MPQSDGAKRLRMDMPKPPETPDLCRQAGWRSSGIDTRPASPASAPPTGHMATTVIIGTRNEGKLDEIRALFNGWALKPNVMGLDELERTLNVPKKSLGDIPEPGTTYYENAELKARALAKAIRDSNAVPFGNRFIIIADDSGLDIIGSVWKTGHEGTDYPKVRECTRLKGCVFPGVDTAPFAKACGGWTPDAFQLLVAASGEDRRADAVTVLHALDVIMTADGLLEMSSESFRGDVKGYLVYPPRGENGFGYDPIFALSPEDGAQTFAQLSQEQKNANSHRGNALKLMWQESQALNRKKI